MGIVRKPFGEVFEGAKDGDGTPLVTLRRMTAEDNAAPDGPWTPRDMIGIFHGATMIACMQFDDLFDEQGNRFYND